MTEPMRRYSEGTRVGVKGRGTGTITVSEMIKNGKRGRPPQRYEVRLDDGSLIAQLANKDLIAVG